MCVKFEVFIPTIETFLCYVELRYGSFVIVVWTLIRALFCYFFFTIMILEVLLRGTLLGIFPTPMMAYSGTQLTIIYMCSLTLVVTSSFLIVTTCYLARGVYLESTHLFLEFLLCRAIVWFIEVICLGLLCAYERILIGWYLGMLLFIILEVYGWLVVYSYYCELEEVEKSMREDSACRMAA